MNYNYFKRQILSWEKEETLNKISAPRHHEYQIDPPPSD